MEVADVLEWKGVSAPLNRPVLVVALTGLFDFAGAATGALDHLIESSDTEYVGGVDPDPFFNFTHQRPDARLDEDDERVILWPANDFTVIRHRPDVVGPNAGDDTGRDIVVLNGVEPHLRWPTFVRCVLAAYTRLGCEALVTVGASPDRVPHTRIPPVVGSSVDAVLARTLGLSRPTYQGVTGVVGVMQAEFEREGLPAVSLRVGVPFYLDNADHPQASAALLRHLEHVLGVPTRHALLNERINQWRGLHDEAVADTEEARATVAALEKMFDAEAEKAIPSADDLAEQFRRFLDDQP